MQSTATGHIVCSESDSWPSVCICHAVIPKNTQANTTGQTKHVQSVRCFIFIHMQFLVTCMVNYIIKIPPLDVHDQWKEMNKAAKQ